MNIIIKGKQMEITPRLRQYIERKVQRLSRLVDEETRIEVTVTEEQTRSARDRYCIQLALVGGSNGSHPIRSEMSGLNANMALDRALNKVLVQLGRQKDRQTTAVRHRTPPVKVLALTRSGAIIPLDEDEETYEDVGTYSDEVADTTVAKEQNDEIWSRVLEIRRVPTRPMDDQEVIAQMEILGASFLP